MNGGWFSKSTLIGMFTFLLVFTAACLVIFDRTGSEPATLITCVFGFCGVEGGALAWIKACKIKNKQKKRKIKKNGDVCK